ncbi:MULTISPECIES: tRNA (adenosine(37)-N6)-dimethylallyltransferase MiaA [unclassified Actinobaculum]|uniref:tRNA (adenosine(37)-N6)-dimethylallyltransferase MiaA n=1 Tax=unclassified Actinobaculum TaxID=2609299 RepID=UPI000D526023|nr:MULTISPECIES: tRNA (adenosine(37)-N6)-dimethylallyltransferase MiaA [unclassified Actinobaculum]AWE42617.1 tRNA (adenosine(37)-N6)-dimethylallyltransferase MiaA [Actinobaculum sp. 313]RTE47954.1 tRNA (adenosine(37)-N6)-dimethylallyltransferase MiaA [Actinobaculum sp. 352]
MIIALVGPTATGKTALSLEVAELLGGPSGVEIISADAMQLYRGMDIGTAKLPASQRRGIVHHQLDVLDINEAASVAAYQRSARADLQGIVSRGKIPIVVGGSGLYVAGLLDKLEFPGHDPHIRAALEETVRREGLQPLLMELEEKDPAAYAAVDHRNPRRVIRAVEVVRLAGRYSPRFPRHTAHFPDIHSFYVSRAADVLADSIARRAEAMMTGGLLEETAALLDEGLRESPTAGSATGYRQAISVLDGLLSTEDAVVEIAQATRRLAKKQRTWFGADPRLRHLDLTDTSINDAARHVVEAAGK